MCTVCDEAPTSPNYPYLPTTCHPNMEGAYLFGLPTTYYLLPQVLHPPIQPQTPVNMRACVTVET